MRKENLTTLSDYPLPDSLSTEIQVIADIIALPETLLEAERMLSPSVFSDEMCREAFRALRAMSHEGMIIDLPSAYGRIDRNLMQKGVIPMMVNSNSALTAYQHFSALKDCYIKRKCYFKAMELLMSSTDIRATGQDLVSQASIFAETLRKDVGDGKSVQHISDVLNDLGEQIEEQKKDREAGKMLRTPTGFYTLNRLTYGGFNAGNLVILAARPSVGKTAVMLQIARAAASAGKSVNLYNLEMTNTELAQRFLYATEQITPLQMAQADIDWQSFEVASGQYASKPIYLSDSLFSEDEILASIKLNSLSGKCGIAFIDYLGLVDFADKRAQPKDAIASFTKKLKRTAKECKIPIVLLCQLNRASASEKRAPQLFDLRDSGSIEQDADTVLMLERNPEDENEILMWVRKNRGGKAGDITVELIANRTFTVFSDKNDPTPPLPTTEWVSDFDNNNSDNPF